MVQQVNKFSDEEKLRLFLHGTNIAMNEASADRKKYIDYSYGEDLELTEDEMKDMELLEILESLGYSNYAQLLNAKNYGIPQNRNRCFMISILGNYYYDFPKKQKLELV